MKSNGGSKSMTLAYIRMGIEWRERDIRMLREQYGAGDEDPVIKKYVHVITQLRKDLAAVSTWVIDNKTIFP